MKPAPQSVPLASPFATRIHAALPQTQCTRCGYADCAGYAAAIATGEAGIDRCPPGGVEGVSRLAAITGQPVRPLDPLCGSEGPRLLAVIDEAWCIGCTLCLDACPTDAIIGASKRMHTVVDVHCTGCSLCVPVCPVDCIALENVSGSLTGWGAWSRSQADQALLRYRQRRERLRTELPGRAPALDGAPANAAGESGTADPLEPSRRKAAVAAALAAARARRGPPRG